MKTIGLLLIGIILGGAGGYVGTQYLMQPQMDELSVQVQTMTETLEQLQSDYETLSSENEDTVDQLETLQDVYATLETDKTTLDEEQATLIEQLELLTEQYESLLDEYETNLGGLDFSNQTIEAYEKSYTWRYNQVNYTIDIAIPVPLYEYYSTKERLHTQDYRGYIVHPYDDAYVKVLLSEFDKIIALSALTEKDKVGLICSFVQSRDYEQDTKTLEYPKYPVETLMDNGGDCEDTSILLSHLLEEMGVNTTLIFMPNHMAIAIEGNSTGQTWIIGNTTYSYMETTATGWQLGEVPFAHKYVEYDHYQVVKDPFLAHNWTATNINEKITARVTYKNETPYDATGYKSWIGIQMEDGQTFGKTGSLIELGFQESKKVTMKMTGPRHSKFKMVIGVISPEGVVENKVYSAFITTR